MVIATERYIAADAIEKVQSSSTSRWTAVIDPFEALKDEVIVRDDKEKKTNHIWHWEAGDKDATDQPCSRGAATVVEQ